MPKLSKAAASELIENLIFNSQQKYSEPNIAKRMYSYLKDYPREEQIAIIEDMIGVAKDEFSSLEKMKLTGRIATAYLHDTTGVLKELKAAATAKKDGKQQSLHDLAQSLLQTVLRHAAIDQAEVVKTEVISDAEPNNLKKSSNKQLEKYLVEDNDRLMAQYFAVVSNIQIYNGLLLEKLTEVSKKDMMSKEKIDECDKLLKHIEKYFAEAIASNELNINEDKLPIPVADLISFANYLVEVERTIDQNVMDQNVIHETRSFAHQLVAALSKFIEGLLNLKRQFVSIFGSAKQPSKFAADAKSTAEANAIQARKNLTLFYNSVKPGMAEALEAIKVEVSKINKLNNP